MGSGRGDIGEEGAEVGWVGWVGVGCWERWV